MNSDASYASGWVHLIAVIQTAQIMKVVSVLIMGISDTLPDPQKHRRILHRNA